MILGVSEVVTTMFSLVYRAVLSGWYVFWVAAKNILGGFYGSYRCSGLGGY